MRSHFLSLLVLAVTTLSPAQAKNECHGRSEELAEDAPTVLRVTLGERSLILSDGMMAYQTEKGLYLPLGALSSALDFSIVVMAEEAMAEGWFLQTDRRFELDLEHCRVTVSGTTSSLEPFQVITDGLDLYVHADWIQAWFPLQLEVDISRLLLEIFPEEKLPIEQRLERLARWQQITGTEIDEEEAYPWADIPYRLWDLPFIDATAETRFRRNENTDKQMQHRYKVVATGDLLYMNTQFSAAGDESEALRDVFLTMGRRDAEGNLLGPLHAREFALGDIGVSQDQLITNSTLGRGIRISSFPLERPEEFHSIDLRGELPLGWDVEMYQNDRLIEFQSGSNRDRYDFTDVPLEFGLNEFRLVFYGPQGQVREETLRKVVGPGMVKPGEQYFHITAMHEREDARLGSLGPAAARLSAAYEHGISQNLSLGGGFKSLDVVGTRHNYGLMNLNTSIAGFFTRLEFTADDNGGHAAAGTLFGHLAGIDISAETARFFDFLSERTLIGGPGELRSRSELRLNTWLPTWRSMNSSLGLTFGREQWSGGQLTDIETRISAGNYRWKVTQQFLAQHFSDSMHDSLRLDNRILFSSRLGLIYLRGELDQEIRPKRQIHNIGIHADWRVGPRTQWRLGLNHSPSQNVSTASTGVNWQFNHLALGGNLQATDQGDYIVGISVSTGIFRDPQSGRWLASARPQTQTGAVTARVFLDQNNNGRRDDNELLIRDAQVRAARTGAISKTDEKGQALLPGLPTDTALAIKLAPESLENPFWLTEGSGRRLRLRSGRSAHLDLPVVPTGTIEGTVYREAATDGERRALSGMSVELFSINSDLVQQTYSAYDGYYAFERLPPGDYRVRTQMPEGSATGATAEQRVTVVGHGDSMVRSVSLVLPMLALEPESPQRLHAARMEPVSADAKDTVGEVRTGGWLMKQASAHFTIQIISMGNEPAVRRFIDQHGLREKAAYFESRHQGKPWFSVVYGQFSDREQTRAALAALPPALREASPWIRSLASIQSDISSLGKALLIGLDNQHIIPRKIESTLANME